MNLPFSVSALWASIIAVEMLLAAFAFRRKLYRSVPAFFLWLCFRPLKRLLLWVILAFAGHMEYFWAYGGASLACCLIASAVLWEVYRLTFGPRAAVPEDAFRRTAFFVVSSLLISAGIALLARSMPGGFLTQMLDRVDRMLVAGLAAGFASVVLCSLLEGYSWRPWPARIAAGFTFFLSLNLASSFAGGWLSSSGIVIAQMSGMFSVLVADLFWIGCALAPAPETPQPLTIAALDEIKSLLDEESIALGTRSPN